MSYQEKCEQLYKDNGLMKDTLKTIRDMNIDIADSKGFVRDAETIKALVKTVLAVVDSED
tara:strand:- start:251 stop:430 length:180 start_codon:yes stop_codon:yes gene_type:complete